ncbi:MAG: hypothetical protein NTV94_10425 [Planctomycetota bacterium]|nr:hypothetical protein [Planctomycetota bacterium]
MNTSSLKIGLAAVLATVFLAACQTPSRNVSAAQRVTLRMCAGHPSCTPTLIKSQADWLLLENKTASTVAYRIERDSAPKEAYRIRLGTYEKPCQVTAQLRLDLVDIEPSTNIDNLAGAAVDAGWAAMIRSAGKPPLRTIRITTGRPALDARTQTGSAPQPPSSNLPPAPEYCMLVAIEPEATSDKGVEYYFLAAPKDTTHTLWLEVGKGKEKKRVDLPSGNYICVNRAEADPGIKPIPFPKKDHLINYPKWLQDAIDAASTKDYPFTS